MSLRLVPPLLHDDDGVEAQDEANLLGEEQSEDQHPEDAHWDQEKEFNLDRSDCRRHQDTQQLESK